MEYLTFIDQVRHLEDLPSTRMQLRGYGDWVKDVLTYLEDFHQRVQPLQDLGKIMVKVEEDFDAKCQADKQAEQPLECAAIQNMSTEEEVQSLGMEKLKSELTMLGMKCGGTLEERARRLFAAQGKLRTELDASFFAKVKGKKGKTKKGED